MQNRPSGFGNPWLQLALSIACVLVSEFLLKRGATEVANIVHVTLRDGRTLTKRVDYPLGNAKNPVSDTELEHKFLRLVAPALGRDRCAKILEHCWQFDAQRNVQHLIKLLRMR